MVQVRESSRFGFCYALGELIGETPSRYIYRNRAGIAYASKGSFDPPRPVHGVRGLSKARRGGLNAPQLPTLWFGFNSSWNSEPGDDCDDQGKGSDHDDRPQRDPDCEWHAPISLHVRSDQTQGAYWGTRQALHETISQRSPRFSKTADSNVGALMTSPPALGFPDATAMPVAHAVSPLM